MLQETTLGVQGRIQVWQFLADSDLKQSSRDNILVSIPVYQLSLVHYFLPVEIIFKKRLLISVHEWSFHIVQQ